MTARPGADSACRRHNLPAAGHLPGSQPGAGVRDTRWQVVATGLTCPKEVDMRYKVTFLAGFAAGFVVGARAGRERYEQLRKLARQTADNPAVQQATAAVQAKAAGLASTATHKVAGQLHDGLASARDKVPGMRSRDSNGHGGGEHPFSR